jgi:hypothetical protein
MWIAWFSIRIALPLFLLSVLAIFLEKDPKIEL